jgi:hypothetical protein
MSTTMRATWFLTIQWGGQPLAGAYSQAQIRRSKEKTWTARRVQSLRAVHKVGGYRSSDKNGEFAHQNPSLH